MFEFSCDLRASDCLTELATLPTASVDMVFADPPFNVGKEYGNGHRDARADYYAWCEVWIRECFRVLKETGTFYLMTIPKHLPKLYPLMDAAQGVFINHVNWRNVSAANDKRSFWSAAQPILVFGKTDAYVFNTFAVTRKTIVQWTAERRENARGQLLDVWDDIPFVYAGSIQHPEAIIAKGTPASPRTRAKAHPCEMPIALIERAILFSTHEGETVLEPFAGLAAGAIACYRHNRHYIGFEQNPEYVALAQARLEKEQAQMRMEWGME